MACCARCQVLHSPGLLLRTCRDKSVVQHCVATDCNDAYEVRMIVLGEVKNPNALMKKIFGKSPEYNRRYKQALDKLGSRPIAHRTQKTYLIQGEKTGLIKIGHTLDVAVRLKELQAWSPDILHLIGVIAGRDAEQNLHAQFHDCRRHGEWFAPNEEMKKFISSLKSTG